MANTANQVLYIKRALEADGMPQFSLSSAGYTHPVLTFTTGPTTITSVVSNFPSGRVNIMGTRRVLNSSGDRQAGYLSSKLLAGSGLSLTTGSSGGNETLSAALATIAANSLLGNNTGGSAVPTALTVAQVAALLAGTTGSTLTVGNDSRFTTITGNNQTGTSYTLVLTDAGKVVECNNAAAITLTVPPVSSVAWPVGTVLEVWQQGAGQVTVTAGAGVTLRSDGGKVHTAAQYATINLRMRANDEWVLSGDLS